MIYMVDNIATRKPASVQRYRSSLRISEKTAQIRESGRTVGHSGISTLLVAIPQ
jgi:hypothetical protein